MRSWGLGERESDDVVGLQREDGQGEIRGMGVAGNRGVLDSKPHKQPTPQRQQGQQQERGGVSGLQGPYPVQATASVSDRGEYSREQGSSAHTVTIKQMNA